MPVEESDDTVKRPALKVAKRTVRKSGSERKKQEHRPEQRETDSTTDTLATQEPDSLISTATTGTIVAESAEITTATDAESAKEPDGASEPTTSTTNEVIDKTHVEHIDTSTSADKEASGTDTAASVSDETEMPVAESEQSPSPLEEALAGTHEAPASEIAQPAVQVEQALRETAVDSASPPATPRPEFDTSSATDEEEGIATGETSPPDTPFAAQFDTPQPDDIDEFDTPQPDDIDEFEPTPSPVAVDTLDPAESEASVDSEASAGATEPIDTTTPVEVNNQVDAETPDGDLIETGTPATDGALIDDNHIADIEPDHTSAVAVSDLPLSWPEIDVVAEDPVLAPLEKRPLPKRDAGNLRRLVGLALLVVFLSSSLLFWQDVSAAHLYVSTLNLSNGAVLTRADYGSTDNGDTLIAPAAGQSNVFFGLAGSQPASPVQQVIELQQNGGQQTGQFSAPLTHGTLSVTRQGNLVIESEHGLEVTTSGGQPLWSMTGNQPALGAHAFHPAFDSTTLYTVKSAATGLIAAYDLQYGALRWTAHINDTLNYAPPLLLDGSTLYVAGDHAIFALNSSDGSLLWAAPHAARTLLLSGNGAHQQLIAASADGLLALNTKDGSPLWSFYGQAGKMTAQGVLSLTPAQFYQASASGTTIFATGTAWKMPEIQPELWLYALDATTGNVRWSRQLASDSTDAGRVFTPLADSTHSLVLLEQETGSGTFAVAAYAASNGQPRWQTPFQGASAASPSLLLLPNNTLLFIAIQADSGAALSAMTLTRLLLLAMTLLSMFGLVLYLLFPRSIRQTRLLMVQQQLTPLWKTVRAKRPAWRPTIIALLLVVIAASTVGYAQLNQARGNVSLVDMHNGTTRWQPAVPASTEALATGGQSSIFSVADGEHLRRVQAIDMAGAIRWQTFASAGTFSVPAVATPPGTLLLALNGHISQPATFAPPDPAYPAPDSLLILSLLNRNTGHPLWQSAIVNPSDQQSAAVIGADAHFIYVASLQTNPPIGSSGAAIQLLAIDQTSGQISWRVSGPSEIPGMPRDNGTLLLQGRQIIWQVEGAVYAIDAQIGQIAWLRSFGNDNAHTLFQEEGQLAETNSLLLVARSQSIYAIDPASGNILWTTPVPGPSSAQSTGGLGLNGNMLLLYGNGQVQAIDLVSHHRIWTRTLPAAIHTLKVAASGKQIYVTLDGNNASGGQLMTLDSKTGATLWHFQLSGQTTFNSDIIEEHNILLATLCIPATGSPVCAQEDIYALNATTGTASWQMTATNIANISISPDGSLLLLQHAAR